MTDSRDVVIAAWPSAHLAFALPNPASYRNQISKLIALGHRQFFIHPDGDPALRESVRSFLCGTHGPSFVGADPDAPDLAHLHFETDGAACSSILMRYIDRPATILAPRTEHHFSRRPIFCVSIPKAGFHLVARVLSDMGYTHRGQLEGAPDPQCAYTFLRNHTHLTCNDLFTNLAHDEHGGAGAEIFKHPVVFCYRHPADLVISEAGYYAEDSVTALASYYGHLPFGRRLLELISDDGMIGTLRDRVSAYKEWMEMPNVLPIAFEELVGESGGGSADVQLATIWAMQLKLHVPGQPREFARYLFGDSNQTFRKGQIGRYRTVFEPRHYAAFSALEDTDYLERFGYDIDLNAPSAGMPGRSAELRHRPLKFHAVQETAPTSTAEAIPEEGNLAEGSLYRWYGYYVGLLRSRYCAIEPGQPRFDPYRDETAARHFVSSRLDSLGRLLAANPVADEPRILQCEFPAIDDVFRARLNVQPLFSDVAGYKVVLARGKIIGIPPELGELDEDDVNLDSIPGLIVGTDQDEVIDRIRKSAGVPWLIAEAMEGHNIVEYQGTYYAIPVEMGGVDLTHHEVRSDEALMRDTCLDTLKTRLQERTLAILNDGQPHLIRENFHGFNLVYLRGRYFGVAQALGPIELDGDAETNIPGLLSAEDLPTLEAAVLRSLGSPQEAASDMCPPDQEIADCTTTAECPRQRQLVSIDNAQVCSQLESAETRLAASGEEMKEIRNELSDILGRIEVLGKQSAALQALLEQKIGETR